MPPQTEESDGPPLTSEAIRMICEISRYRLELRLLGFKPRGRVAYCDDKGKPNVRKHRRDRRKGRSQSEADRQYHGTHYGD